MDVRVKRAVMPASTLSFDIFPRSCYAFLLGINMPIDPCKGDISRGRVGGDHSQLSVQTVRIQEEIEERHDRSSLFIDPRDVALAGDDDFLE